MSVCDSEAWSREEVDYYIPTSDVLCANSLKETACSALLFLCSPGVEWKQFGINLARFQLNRLGYKYAINKNNILQGFAVS